MARAWDRLTLAVLAPGVGCLHPSPEGCVDPGRSWADSERHECAGWGAERANMDTMSDDASDSHDGDHPRGKGEPMHFDEGELENPAEYVDEELGDLLSDHYGEQVLARLFKTLDNERPEVRFLMMRGAYKAIGEVISFAVDFARPSDDNPNEMVVPEHLEELATVGLYFALQRMLTELEEVERAVRRDDDD